MAARGNRSQRRSGVVAGRGRDKPGIEQSISFVLARDWFVWWVPVEQGIQRSLSEVAERSLDSNRGGAALEGGWRPVRGRTRVHEPVRCWVWD